MSAYILDERGFNQLASELYAHATLQHSALNWTICHFLRVHYDNPAPNRYEANLRDFVQRCYDANVEAVNQRYEEKSQTWPLDFKAASGLPKWSNVQLVKHLECLSYQCAEGDVPNGETYKQLEELIGMIARAIVGGLDKYQQSNWGWDTEIAA